MSGETVESDLVTSGASYTPTIESPDSLIEVLMISKASSNGPVITLEWNRGTTSYTSTLLPSPFFPNSIPTILYSFL